MSRSKTYGEGESLNKFAIVDDLNKLVADPESVSRFLREQLVELGFLTKTKNLEAKKEGRGRAPIAYLLTGKAKSYRSLSGQWKRPETSN